MKCAIIRDLMPSYVDGIASEESNLEIEKHLEECGKCREYKEFMEKTIEEEARREIDIDAVKPFWKVKRALNLRTILLIIVIIGFAADVIYGQYSSYYKSGRDASVEDVKIEYRAIDYEGSMKIITLCYRPEKDNVELSVGYTSTLTDNGGKEEMHMVVVERNISPLEPERVNLWDTWEYCFLDENTVLDMLSKEEIQLTGEERLIIHFAGDETKEIRMKDLYTGEGLEGVEIMG